MSSPTRVLPLVVLLGCYASTLYSPTARLPRAATVTGSSVEMEVIRERESGREHEAAFREMERTLRRELPRAHGFRARMQGDIRVEIRLNEIAVRTHNARSRTAVLAMCAIVLLFPACAFIGSTPKEIRELRTRWTVEVFDPEGESAARVEHETVTRAGIGRATPGEHIAFLREMAVDAARQVIRESHDSIRRNVH